VRENDVIGTMFEALYTATDMHGVIIDVFRVLDYAIGSELDDLRRERNLADYVLIVDSGRPMNMKRASLDLRKAQLIIGKSLPDETKLESKISLITRIVTKHYLTRKNKA